MRDVSKQLKTELYQNMQKREITIKGITYTVRATTEQGVEDAIRMLKKSLKQNKEEEE